MNSAKNVFGLALAAAFVVATVVGISVVSVATAQAATYTPSYSTTYTPSSSSGSGSSGSTYTPSYSTTYTPSSSGVTHYDTGCCKTTGSTYTPSYSTTYTPSTYTPSYSTTYTPSNYTTYTYTTGGGCTSNCGGQVYIPKPTPTCTVSVNKTSIVKGEGVTVTWGSSNAQYGNISNVGTYLPTSGSYTVYPQQNTTFNGTFYGNDKTATCSASVVVTQPQPEPTCSITATPGNITSGQSVSIVWSSTNAQYGHITNVGNNLSPNGSYVVYPTGNTTYTGTFYSNSGKQVTCSTTVYVSVQQCPAGYTGSYPNCYPPQQNNLSCTISINNYGQGYSNGYWQPNSAITLSWNSNSASYGSINNGFGNVGPSGSRTVYPTQTTTYTGTFYNYAGQQVTCSATVYINNSYVPPVYPNTPFVTLSAVPYTGLELGPVGTALYWGFIAFWCLLAAYLIVVKKVQNSVYNSLKTVLFGSAATHAVAGHSTHTAYTTPVVRNEDKTDDFIMAQISRAR